MKTWYYALPNDQPGEGWAHIMLSENGMFSAVSDFGNYAFMWTHTGTDDIRAFFLKAEKEWDYFARKLKPDKVLNEKASWKRIKQALLEQRRNKDLSREQAREAWDDMELYSSWNEYLESTSCNTVFDEPWDFSVYELQIDVVAFCKRVLPRLAEVFRAELDGRPHLSHATNVVLGKCKKFCITSERLKELRVALDRRIPQHSIFQNGWVEQSCDVRDGKLYPHAFPWRGSRRTVEYLAETLKAFDGQAEITVLWSDGETTGLSLDDHQVIERPVTFSLVK